MYTPDNWVIIRITNDDEIIYKILAGWSGGYLDGSSWRMNSGITRVQEEDNHILFHGISGSVYHCNKHAEGLRSNCSYILAQLQHKFPGKIGPISYANFLEEFIET